MLEQKATKIPFSAELHISAHTVRHERSPRFLRGLPLINLSAQVSPLLCLSLNHLKQNLNSSGGPKKTVHQSHQAHCSPRQHDPAKKRKFTLTWAKWAICIFECMLWSTWMKGMAAIPGAHFPTRLSFLLNWSRPTTAAKKQFSPMVISQSLLPGAMGSISVYFRCAMIQCD